MNKKSKAAVAAVTALVVGSVSVFSVSAETYKVQINCPYMNLTVRDSDGEIPEGLELKLVDAEGTAVAEWTVGDEKNAYVSDKVLNISGGMNEDSIYSGEYDFDISDYCTDIDADDIISMRLEDGAASVVDPAEMKVGESYDLRVEYKDEESTDLTVPAGSYYIAADENYKDRIIKCYIAVDLFGDYSYKTYCLNDNYGEIITGEAEPGKYRIGLGRTDSGRVIVSTNGWSIDIDDAPTEYRKVVFNISEIDGANDDGTMISDKNYKYDLKTGMLDGRRCDFYFSSGSVVTAAIPDENGNVSVYVNKDDKKLKFAIYFSDSDIFDWNKKLELKSEKTAAIIDTSIDIPTDALTLYDIPSGEYTVTTDSTEYVIENNMIEVSDTKDLQMLELKVKKQSDSSSQSSENDESSESSSAASSSVSDTSTADTSSDTESSDISSLAESSVSQSGNSSAAGSSSAGKNDSNPNTGAAAGSAAVLVVIGGAVVTFVKKKNK